MVILIKTLLDYNKSKIVLTSNFHWVLSEHNSWEDNTTDIVYLIDNKYRMNAECYITEC